MPNRPRRRNSLRLPGYDYSSPGAYFVTAVTRHREHLFGEVVNGEMRLNAFGEIVRDVWQSLPTRYERIRLDEFVIMPNHVHGILWIVEDENSLSVGAIHELPRQKTKTYRLQRRQMRLPKVIGYFKMNTAKRINLLRGTPALPVWQRNYYDHILRDERALRAIRRYIRGNPLNWENDRENR